MNGAGNTARARARGEPSWFCPRFHVRVNTARARARGEPKGSSLRGTLLIPSRPCGASPWSSFRDPHVAKSINGVRSGPPESTNGSRGVSTPFLGGSLAKCLRARASRAPLPRYGLSDRRRRMPSGARRQRSNRGRQTAAAWPKNQWGHTVCHDWKDTTRKGVKVPRRRRAGRTVTRGRKEAEKSLVRRIHQ